MRWLRVWASGGAVGWERLGVGAGRGAMAWGRRLELGVRAGRLGLAPYIGGCVPIGLGWASVSKMLGLISFFQCYQVIFL